MDTMAALKGANTPTGPSLMSLPFGGLGLDVAEAGRKVLGLELEFVPVRGTEPLFEPLPSFAHFRPSGRSLLFRLCRETLGS